MIIERIRQILDYKSISERQFCKEVGIANGFLSKVKDIGTAKVNKILYTYADINPLWLLTGEGNMLKSIEPVDITDISRVSECNSIEYDQQMIPLYGIEATASILASIETQSIIPETHIRIPNLSKVDGAVYVTGDSMYPILKSGDIVIFQNINNIDYIIYGNIYLISFGIDGDEYVVLKYIHKSESSDNIKLVSHNTNHCDFDIPRSSIRSLALIKASIRYNAL